MVNKTIKDYQDNTSIDGANDYFLGQQNSTGDYRRYTRNTIMGVTGQPADISSTQTFTNKTLTSPVIPSIYQDAGKTKLMTLPNTASDTLVSKNSTDTLTNKTLTAPTITAPTVTGGVSVTGTLAAANNATVGGTLGVTSNVTVGGTLTVTGNETVGGTLNVTGVATVDSLTSTATTSTIPTEAVNLIGAAGKPAFENSWVQYNPGITLPCGYYKDPFGFVHVQGWIKSGTLNGVAACFTLPVGYRPPYRLQMASVSVDAFAEVAVAADGKVIPQIGSNTWFCLDNIFFKVA